MSKYVEPPVMMKKQHIAFLERSVSRSHDLLSVGLRREYPYLDKTVAESIVLWWMLRKLHRV